MIVNIVVITINIFVFIPKFDDAKTLGIKRKTIKGLTTPHVK